MATGRREWQAWLCGVAAAAALCCWASTLLPLLGLLALARCLGSASALFVAPSLPRRLLPDLGRRAVLVTGCGSGFGYEAALRLHAQGLRVFAGVRNPKCHGAEVLRSKASPRLRVLPLDVTKDEEVAAAHDAITKELEEHDCELLAVVNNAGVCKEGEAEWMSIDGVKQCLDVNTLGLIRVTQVFLPLLRKSKGRVVNVLSLAGRAILTGLSPYAISKRAALVFCETLRVELNKFGISVHNLEPGSFNTPMLLSSVNKFDQLFEEIPANIRNVYTDYYIQRIKALMILWVALTSADESKIYQVVDDIEDACLSEDPLPRYLSGGNTKFAEVVCPLLPRIQIHLLDFLVRSKTQQ